MLRPPQASPGSRRRRLALLSGLVWLWALLAVSQAAVTSAITADGTLGTTVTPSGQSYVIGGGTLRGNNLFQSFDRFTVGTGATATFTGPAGTANILSRVTGGQRSEIDGRLQSTIQGANLYLLNPSGVMFGPNASLDVSGSFHVSTADFLRFADGATFFANLSQDSVLTVASPAAFGFLGPMPAPIAIQSSALHIPPGHTVSVVGGDLTLIGQGPLQVGVTVNRPPTLGAPGGRVQLVSVAAPGEVVFNPLELAPDLRMEGFTRLGQITLSQGAYLDARGNGGGAVLMRGGRLVLDGSAILVDNLGDQDGVGLGIDFRVTGEASLRNGTLIRLNSYGAGHARDLHIQAGSVRLAGSSIHSFSMNSPVSGPGTGQVGNLTITATDAIIMAPDTIIEHLVCGTGCRENAGRVALAAPTLTMDKAFVGSFSVAGSSVAASRSGGIVVEVERLTLTNGAGISTTSSGSQGAGDLTITATDSIVLSGRSLTAGIGSRFTSSDIGGRGGQITVTTPHLLMDDGAHIEAETGLAQSRGGDIQLHVGTLALAGGAQISNSSGIEQAVFGMDDVFGGGQGGRITIVATDRVSISGQSSGLFSRARRLVVAGKEYSFQGSGGDIDLRAREIRLTEGATISATSDALGPAGNLHISATEGFWSDRSTVTTAASLASGGNITLTAGSRVQLRASELTASVAGGPQTTGGNLTINAPSVIAEGSQIRANAVAGMGGHIQIDSRVFLADPASVVSASSELGISGSVNIQAPATSLSGTLAPLPQAFVNVAELLPARCAARFRGGKASSLVLGGRGGLPPDPGGVLPSPLVLDERLVADPVLTGAPHRQPSAATFALLAGQEKALPRLGCPQ
jgi:filamentous hemagglutinin family protein